MKIQIDVTDGRALVEITPDEGAEESTNLNVAAGVGLLMYVEATQKMGWSEENILKQARIGIDRRIEIVKNKNPLREQRIKEIIL